MVCLISIFFLGGGGGGGVAGPKEDFCRLDQRGSDYGSSSRKLIRHSLALLLLGLGQFLCRRSLRFGGYSVYILLFLKIKIIQLKLSLAVQTLPIAWLGSNWSTLSCLQKNGQGPAPFGRPSEHTDTVLYTWHNYVKFEKFKAAAAPAFALPEVTFSMSSGPSVLQWRSFDSHWDDISFAQHPHCIFLHRRNQGFVLARLVVNIASWVTNTDLISHERRQRFPVVANICLQPLPTPNLVLEERQHRQASVKCLEGDT